MVGNSGHGNPPHPFAPLFAREHQLKGLGNGAGILKKGLVEIPDSIQQDGLGILVFEVYKSGASLVLERRDRLRCDRDGGQDSYLA